MATCPGHQMNNTAILKPRPSQRNTRLFGEPAKDSPSAQSSLSLDMHLQACLKGSPCFLTAADIESPILNNA
jgi:hypothetical protein